jgi:EAL domain-containing protein (putative c-di-GMP-specific phosphodiesterase class I)
MIGTRTMRLPDCRPLLADADDLTLVFQPVVDLAAAAVAGYRALARFPGVAGPDVWFAAAAGTGVAAELEALTILKALDALDRLPADTFLTVDVSTHLLGTDVVQRALGARDDLDRVVLRLTGHTRADGTPSLRRQGQALRERGALVALDATGSGGSGLQQTAALQPELVTLDRSLVAGVDMDPVRAALARTVGELAGTIGAWALAEGIETAAELATLARLGVPLGQGWLLGRPSPEFLPLAPEVARLVRTQVARAQRPDSVARLLRPVRQCVLGEDAPGMPPAVLVGPQGEPSGLLLCDPRTSEVYTAPVSLRVPPSTDVGDALRRALARPPAQRFDPVLCTDPNGSVLGLLRTEDLASAGAAPLSGSRPDEPLRVRPRRRPVAGAARR